MAKDRVRYVLFDVPLHPGNLTLVEMEDGTLRVLMNDEPLAGCHWQPGNVPAAVQKFQQIKSDLVPRDYPQ